jgi:N-acetylglutamate synthase-like GNAT family acetyltransferase
MNLSVSARGQGLGKLLIQHLVTRLKGAQIAGVHLCCAEGPVKFYKEQGFIELEKVTLKSGISIFMLGRLTSAV